MFFLHYIRFYILFASQLLQKISKPPTRSWINYILNKIHMYLRDCRNIKLQRLTGCNVQILENYFNLLYPYIHDISPFLIFGADETMLETLLGTKVIVPKDCNEAIAADVEEFPHISVMCCHSIYGEVMPPFMILPTIQQLPNELKIFAESGQIDIACAPSGYMNRDCFLFLAICFINHLNVYRQKLPINLRTSRAVLILDGHSTRGCSLALWLLDQANVDVITEPSNTSHVVQMFDVCLVSPIKFHFRKLFHKLEKNDPTTFQTIIARLRNHAAQAIISAWATASGIINRISSGRATGIYPFNPKEVYESRFVIQLTEKQVERQAMRDSRRMAGLDINCKLQGFQKVLISKLFSNEFMF